MSDILTRLRHCETAGHDTWGLYQEARTEIERLRAGWLGQAARDAQEIARLEIINAELVAALQVFAIRAYAPGADLAPDEGTVTFFMVDCRRAGATITRAKGETP